MPHKHHKGWDDDIAWVTPCHREGSQLINETEHFYSDHQLDWPIGEGGRESLDSLSSSSSDDDDDEDDEDFEVETDDYESDSKHDNETDDDDSRAQ